MKLLKRTLVAALLLAVAALAGSIYYEYDSRPIRSGQLNLQGLNAAVTVDFDQWAVPHIQANNQEDAYFTLGYLQAQDRLLQMDGIRRISQGRLAEVVGPKMLESDRFFRSLGIHRKAKNIVASADKNLPVLKMMQAYVDGINQYIATAKLPLEVLFMGGKPKEFTLVDAVSASAYIAFTFDRGLKTDSWIFKASKILEPEFFADLDLEAVPINGYAQKNIRHGKDQWAVVEDAMNTYGRFNGSNSWVVSGKNTASGKPILANDTHIRFSNPSTWYEAHLKAPGLNLYGYFLPSISLPLLGHSKSHAWGITIFHNDDLDIAIENPDPQDPHKVLRKGQSMPLISYKEDIKVRGLGTVNHIALESEIGPVFKDLIPGETVSVRWSFLHSGIESFNGFFDLFKAETIEQATAATQLIQAPSLNILYANHSGDIARFTTGFIPNKSVKRKHMTAMDADDYSIGYQPLSMNPSSINPESGYVSSANEQPNESTRGYYSYPERARRLHQILGQNKKWTIEDSKKLQLNTEISFHQKPLMSLAKALHSKQAQAHMTTEAYGILNAWNGDHGVDAIAPTIFYQFLYELMENTFQDELGPKLFKDFVGREFGLKTMLAILEKPKSPWWDNESTEYQEKQADIILNSWRKTMVALEEIYGRDVNTWIWGRHHTILFKHPLGNIPGLSSVYNLGPYPAPGGVETINQISFRMRSGPVNAVHGPATRRLVDLANPEEAYSILPTGQSGRVIDSHFGDQAGLFLEGKYRKASFEVNLDDPRSLRLTLKPRNPKNLNISKK